MAQRPGRGFRRLEERVTHTAPLPIAWGFGLVLGAIGGLVFYAWETLLLRSASVPLPDGDARWTALGVSMGVGAVLGWCAASAGLYGPRWGTATTVGLAGFLLSAKAGTWLADGGGPAIVGVVFVACAGIALGQLAGRMPVPGWAHQAVSGVVFLGLALLVPLHVHLLPSATTGGALAVTGVVLLVATALTSVAAAVTVEGRAPVIALLGALGVAGLGHVLVGLRAPPVEWPTSTAPPVVLIVVSGLRADRVGFLGYDRPSSPRLDELAREALVFEDTQATSNWSVPSLASMLTGRLPYGHGAGLNGGEGGLDTPLRPDLRTVAQVLRDDGVRTGAVVADPQLRTYALDTGFQRWMDDPGQGALPSALVPLAVAGVDPTGWPRRSDADRVSDRAIAFAQEQDPAGWFLLVQFSDAGGPFTPTPADEADAGYTTRPWPSDLYDASIRRVDRAIGRLVDALPPSCWVIVVGDRGVDLGEVRAPETQGRIGARFGHTMYRELLHVPLIIRAPGLPPGRVREVTSVVDIGPTVLQALGVPPLPRAEGTALERAFGSEHVDRPVIAQSSLFGPEQQVAIVAGHKLILTTDDRSPVYDREADPAEVTPLRPSGAENGTIERQLRTILPPSGAGANLTPRPSLVLQIGQFASMLGPGGR